jgi:hypothetical protein
MPPEEDVEYNWCPAAEELTEHPQSPDIRFACCGKRVPPRLQKPSISPPDRGVNNLWCPISKEPVCHKPSNLPRFGCCGRLVPASLRIIQLQVSSLKQEDDLNNPVPALNPVTSVNPVNSFPKNTDNGKYRSFNVQRQPESTIKQNSISSSLKRKHQSRPPPPGIEVISIDSDEEKGSDLSTVTSRSSTSMITGSFHLPLKHLPQRSVVEAARRASFKMAGHSKSGKLSRFQMCIPDIISFPGAKKIKPTESNAVSNSTAKEIKPTVLPSVVPAVSETRHLHFWIGPSGGRWSSFLSMGIFLLDFIFLSRA